MRDKNEKINTPFLCLNNLFVNGHGQLADNLETSRSLLALQVRRERQAERGGFQTVKDLEEWERQCNQRLIQGELKKLGQERDEVLKAAVKLPVGLLRTNKFRRAITLANEIKNLSKKIALLKKV